MQQPGREVCSVASPVLQQVATALHVSLLHAVLPCLVEQHGNRTVLRVAFALTLHPCRRRRLQEAEQRLSEAQLEADQARSMVAASDEKVAVASEAAVAADARAADAQQAAVVAATREQAARQAAEAVQLALQESQR